MELRCDKRLHGVIEDGVLKVACRSALCGHVDGVVVIHEFDLTTGEFVRTTKYKDAPNGRKERTDGSRCITPVRHA